MDTATILIICYCFQLPLAAIALFFMPGRGTLSTPMENLRRNSAILGLLPCAFFAVFAQVIALGIYYTRIRSLRRKSERAWSDLGGATSAPSGGVNPFSSPPGGGQSASVNPFLPPPGPNGPMAGPGGDGGPRANPFV